MRWKYQKKKKTIYQSYDGKFHIISKPNRVEGVRSVMTHVERGTHDVGKWKMDKLMRWGPV